MSDVLAAAFPLYFRIEVVIPVADNDGQAFPFSRFEEFERHVLTVVNGLSCREALVRGLWYAIRDHSREYFIDVESDVLARDLAIAIAQFVVLRFRQRAVNLTVHPRYSALTLTASEVLALSTPLTWVLLEEESYVPAA